MLSLITLTNESGIEEYWVYDNVHEAWLYKFTNKFIAQQEFYGHVA